MSNSNTNNNNNNNNTDHRRNDPKYRAELIIAQSILQKVLDNVKNITLQSKENANISLTEYEKPVFSKYTYQGWGTGVVTGGIFFTCIFGGMRFMAYRRFIKSQQLPSSTLYHTKTISKLQQYKQFDQPNVKSTKVETLPTQKNNNNNETSLSIEKKFELFSSETIVQVQFLITMAISVLIGTITANLASDKNQFLKDVSELPIKPGTSYLFHNTCPYLIQYKTQLDNMHSMKPLYEQRCYEQQKNNTNRSNNNNRIKRVGIIRENTNNNSSNDNNNDSNNNDEFIMSPMIQAILPIRPIDLLNDPKSDNLYNMIRLIQNCQHRIEYEKELKKKRNNNNIHNNNMNNFTITDQQQQQQHQQQSDDNNIIINIPEDGVPIRYIPLQETQQ